MQQIVDNQNHWSPCQACNSRGKVASRKNPSLSPFEYINICKYCDGSGLTSNLSTSALRTNLPHIAIVGGGVGGAALAVACKHRGIPFTLYEKDASLTERSQGYGLTLQQASNAMRALGITDIKDAVTSDRHIVFDQEGNSLGEWGMRTHLGTNVPANTKRKNMHISRQSLRSQLLDQLDEHNDIRWGHTLESYSQDPNSIRLNFSTRDGVVKDKTDLLVGADGIHSTVRKLAYTNDPYPLQYLDCIVILGICCLKDIHPDQHDLLDQKTVFQTVNGRERIYVMPYDQNKVMWQLSYKIDEQEARDLRNQGSQALKQHALQITKSWHSPVCQIIQVTSADLITGYPVYDRKSTLTGHISDIGSVCLIGDASHPMSPFKGQGANQAILDALCLSHEIYNKCNDKQTWQEQGIRPIILNEFEQHTNERVSSKVEGSRYAASVLHSEKALRKDNNPRSRRIN